MKLKRPVSEFAQRIYELRVDKGASQCDIADAIGVSKGIVSLWENGLREPTMANLIALANYFGVTLDYIVGRTDTM